MCKNIALLMTATPESGGAYQYALSVLYCFDKLLTGYKCTVYYQDPENSAVLEKFPRLKKKLIEDLKEKGLISDIRNYGVVSLLKKLKRRIVKTGIISCDKMIVNTSFRKQFITDRMDLLVCTSPSPIGFESGIPFIMPVHDLQHKLQPDFEEFQGQEANRDYMYSNAVKHASAIWVDSQIGKDDVVSIYGVNGDNIRVLPFVPWVTVENKELKQIETDGHNLPEDFIFYPAQMWTHKNHIRLLKALDILKSRDDMKIELVLTGGKKNASNAIMNYINSHDLEDQVHMLGYVDEYTLDQLYKKAVALVFPTFFGPTNIPVYEAFSLGCPVLTSDIRGIREQVKDAALLFDPNDEKSIAESIKRIYMEKDLRKDLINKAKILIETNDIKSFALRIDRNLKELGR